MLVVIARARVSRSEEPARCAMSGDSAEGHPRRRRTSSAGRRGDVVPSRCARGCAAPSRPRATSLTRRDTRLGGRGCLAPRCAEGCDAAAAT